MSYAMDHDYNPVVADAPATARVAFIRRTYLHLAGAILVFAGLEAALLSLPGIGNVVVSVLSIRFSWLMILLGFMFVSWIADSWARSDKPPSVQYLGLGLYVVAEAVIFLPLLWIADTRFPGAIATAGVLTLAMFVGLTLAVFISGHDFSFLRTYLCVGGFIALGLIVAAILIGFDLGLWFSLLMVALASGYIIYYTSNIIHQYRTDQHVAAALALFASVALLFWYILRIVMGSRR